VRVLFAGRLRRLGGIGGEIERGREAWADALDPGHQNIGRQSEMRVRFVSNRPEAARPDTVFRRINTRHQGREKLVVGRLRYAVPRMRRKRFSKEWSSLGINPTKIQATDVTNEKALQQRCLHKIGNLFSASRRISHPKGQGDRLDPRAA